MARKKGGFNRRYLKGVINAVDAPGALGSKAVSTTDFPDTVSEKTWISSIVASWSLANMTPAANAGPFLVGVAHTDYSNPEIEEFLESVGSWDEGDLVQSRETSRRLIRQVGTIGMPDDASDIVELNDGKPIRTKCGFYLQSGQTLQLFVYNLGGSSISGTTSPQFHARGHVNLWPK